LTSLVKKIDERLESAAGKTPRPLGAYFLFENNPGGLDQQLRGVAEKHGLKRINFCIGAVPPRYEVNKEADVTVVIYSVGRRPEQAVTANFALRKGDLDDAKIDAIVKALSNVLPR
jgi:hypothetical protein